jgi:transcriptional regulator with XRE-family HTH domain
MTTTTDIGDVIRAARKEHRLTQKQLAELAGVSERTLRDIERGGQGASLRAVLALAAAVGVRVEAR